MKSINIILVAILLVQVGYTPCVAQEIPAVAEGDRVRIKAPSVSSNRIVGKVMKMDADILVVKVKSFGWDAGRSVSVSKLMRVPVASLTKLDGDQGQEDKCS